ncbi:MAG: alpha/beta hydrolase [Oscillospiraceae bacterium]|nr:alpha/beta hydrolase [Oscillospiraceae bacterium]
MLHQKLNIEVDYQKLGLEKTGDHQPTLECYVPYNTRTPAVNRPTVIICPGGGYAHTSDREAEPIALGFLNQGFNCFVVWYSTTSSAENIVHFPTSLFELATAVSMVRANAEEWLVDKDKIYVCGFSAGGHLAASLGTLWNRDFLKDALGFHNEEHKPNGLVLSYPVILAPTNGKPAHYGSFANLLGDKVTDNEMLELLSLEKQVSSDTPPAFLWHTFTDQLVPVRNSIDFAAAMADAGVSCEMHIYPYGPHGTARADDTTSVDGNLIVPECQEWITLASRWIKSFN